MDKLLLGPVMALVGWTLVMLLWLYATRIPALKHAKLQPNPYTVRGEQMYCRLRCG